MARTTDSSRVNVVLIVTDDQGAWAVPWRMPELVMPELQRLADAGIVLDEAHCASPVCSPARASMITGRMPSAHGVHDWIVTTDAGTADGFLADQPSLARTLAGNGYTCAMIGKWHLGDSSVAAAGYSTWYAHRAGGGPYTGAPIWRDGTAVTESRHFTEAVGDEAVAFVAEAAGEGPFFLHMNFTAPHDPWFAQHPQRLTDLYEATDFPSVPAPPEHEWFAERREGFAEAIADRRGALVGYCASLTGVDEQIGRVRRALDEHGVADRTVVIVVSDNGFACGHHGIWGKGNGTVPTNMWNSSVRVPFVLHDPTRSLPARSTQPWSTAGIFDTVCEAAGVARPSDGFRAGQSLYAALDSDEPGEVVILDEYGSARMIRLGDWKMITRPGGPDELFDLAADPDEEHNLAGEIAHRDRARRMRRRLDERFAALARPVYDAARRAVSGFGQRLPVDLGRGDAETYLHGPTAPARTARTARDTERPSPLTTTGCADV